MSELICKLVDRWRSGLLNVVVDLMTKVVNWCIKEWIGKWSSGWNDKI